MSVCQKFAGGVIKVAFSVSVRTIWSKLIWKTCVFLLLLDFNWNIFAFINFLSAEVAKTAIYVSIRTFWGKLLSWKAVYLIVFRIELQTFQKFNDTSPAGLSKFHYTIHESGRTFWGKSLLFEKRSIFYHSRTLNEKLSPNFRVFFSRQLSKLHSTCLNQHFWKKKYIFRNNFHHVFLLLSGVFSAFSRSFSDCLVKTAF